MYLDKAASVQIYGEAHHRGTIDPTIQSPKKVHEKLI